MDLAFWALIMGFLGGRILYIITQWDYYSENPAQIFKIWQGGLVFLGGVLLTVPFSVWYIRRFKLDLWKVLDNRAC